MRDRSFFYGARLAIVWLWILRLEGQWAFSPKTTILSPRHWITQTATTAPSSVSRLLLVDNMDNGNTLPGRSAAGIPRRRLFMSSTSNDQKQTNSAAAAAARSSGEGQQVIYQKVVRPSKVLPDLLFLGYLVEYLESHFKLPSKLPMTYEVLTPNKGSRCVVAWNSPLSPSPELTCLEVEVVGIYSDNQEGAPADNSTTQQQHQQPSVPNMAMLVVRKQKVSSTSQQSIPPMMQNLFADSEKRIIRALDRGLEDFMMGKIKFEDQKKKEEALKRKQANVKTAKEAIAIEAELVDDDNDNNPPPSIGSSTQGNNKNSNNKNKLGVEDAVIVDSTRASDPAHTAPGSKKKQTISKEDREASIAAAMETMKIKTETTTPIVKNNKTVETGKSVPPGTDFAVEAAKQAANKKRQSNQVPAEDFAVAAAKKAAGAATKANQKGGTSKQKAIPKQVKGTTTKPMSSSRPTVVNGEALRVNGFDRNLPQPPTRHSFRTTISRPEDRAKRNNKRDSSKTNVTTRGQAPSQQGNPAGVAEVGPALAGKKSSTSATVPSGSTRKSGKINGKKEEEEKKETVVDSTSTINANKRNVNINVVTPETDDSKIDPFNARIDELQSTPAVDQEPGSVETELKKDSTSANQEGTRTTPQQPSREQIERDILKAAADVMDGMAEEGKEMTPEELLQDVLKFDAEQKQENTAGTGFASGAFDKAKELLREQSQKREARLQAEEAKSNAAKQQQNSGTETKELTIQEELRRMFEAGQSIAEGRITKVENGQDVPSSLSSTTEGGETTEEDVDRLIAAEKSISSHARVLDEELSELEVRINASPDEEFDGPRKNPFFDVLSGPEVYNPNVDPETVNYPGAMPGTKDIRLPKDLEEAVRQARFATNVLQNMQEIEHKDEATGKVMTTYQIGKQELSEEQVDNLQKVVVEAVNIGLIEDPINLMAERSRLQMVLDELWDQPEERFRDIASNYKDLLLSDQFTILIKERLNAMADRDVEHQRRGGDDEALLERHSRERVLLNQLVVYAQLLLKEARALGAELEAQQLEIVRSICKVAMDPSHTTEEETAMALSDVVRDMRPLLDDMFVAYLKYAVAEERGRLSRAGLLDDPEHNQWLFVLQIVQQGVYNEISRGINRYLEHIWYVLRMETPKERRMLLSKLIDVMPTMDVRPFVQVVENIVGSLGDAVRGEFEDAVELGEMTNKLLQLHRDVKELLPPERIAKMSRDADEWAAGQKKKLMEQRKVSEQRLQAARDTAHLQGDIDALARRGETERIE